MNDAFIMPTQQDLVVFNTPPHITRMCGDIWAKQVENAKKFYGPPNKSWVNDMSDRLMIMVEDGLATRTEEKDGYTIETEGGFYRFDKTGVCAIDKRIVELCNFE